MNVNFRLGRVDADQFKDQGRPILLGTLTVEYRWIGQPTEHFYQFQAPGDDADAMPADDECRRRFRVRPGYLKSRLLLPNNLYQHQLLGR